MHTIAADTKCLFCKAAKGYLNTFAKTPGHEIAYLLLAMGLIWFMGWYFKV